MSSNYDAGASTSSTPSNLHEYELLNIGKMDIDDQIAASILQEIGSLGKSTDLPPFISLTKLPQGVVFTVKKVIMRTAGEQNATYSGIQIYLDDCRTNLPSK